MSGVYFVLNDKGRVQSGFELELFSELKCLKEKLYSRLDQYLKVLVKNKGITIIKNTYTGFNTEFEEDQFTTNKNKLLFVQPSVQRRIIMNLANVEPLYISYIHTHTSAVREVLKK